jgi:hypothetical protein
MGEPTSKTELTVLWHTTQHFFSCLVFDTIATQLYHSSTSSAV